MIKQDLKNIRSSLIRIEGLDALRGTLSILVCIAHAWQTFVSHYENGVSATYFVLGVMARGSVLCFFCLSGYVITLSIDKNIKKNSKFNFKNYVSSRFWRIVPPLVVVMIATLIMSAGLELVGANRIPESMPATRHTFETNFLSQIRCLSTACAYGDLPGNGFNGPLWSLVFEIQLYAISGTLAYLILSAKKISHRIVGSILLGIYVFHVLKLHHGFKLNMQIVSYCCYFFGSCLYLLDKYLNNLKTLIIITILSLATFILGYWTNYHDETANMESSNWLLFQLVVGGLLSFMVAGIAKVGLFHQLESLGKFSYTLYIFHFPLMMLIYFCTFNFAPSFLKNYYFLFFAISILIVIFLNKKLGFLIEQPNTQREYFRRKVIDCFRKKALT